MKWIFLILTSCFFYFSAYAGYFDLKSDAAIFEYIQSKEFSNSVISYSYGGKNYPIRMIHNPKNQLLYGNDLCFKKPTTLSLVILGNLPLTLARYLEDLVLNQFKEEDWDIDLRVASKYIAIYGQLKPAIIGKTIDAFDDEIRQVFQSEDFVNHVFYYYLNDEYFKVRIIHNPKNLRYTASLPYNINGTIEEQKITHNHKYEIIVDNKAPKELIKHLCPLTNASWWDWYYNFIVYNGTDVECREPTLDGYYFWTLDRVFHFTQDLKLETP